MRWIQNLLALITCAAGIVWAFPDAPIELAGRISRSTGITLGNFDPPAWLNAGPVLLVGLGAVSLLAANVGRGGGKHRNSMNIVFDPRGPKFIEHDVWRGPANEDLRGVAYRVGVRNDLKSALHDVLVITEIQGDKPVAARFLKDKAYRSDIAPHATEFVELFMMRDQDIADHLKFERTIKVRVCCEDAVVVSRTFRFDSQAAIPLTPA